MGEMEEKLSSILGNPQMMEKIMSLAQTMQGTQEPPQSPQPEPGGLGIDPGMMQALAGLAQKNTVDSQQKALLAALAPYLSQRRREKLERAMRAARMAALASSFLNAGGLKMLGGR